MRISKLRFWMAGVVALLVGIPMTEKAMAQPGDIIYSGLRLAGAIANSAGAS
jgi:hypothetical protein